MEATYTIGTLAGLTGLSAHTIRAWERRYGALSPGRTDTNRRVYAAQDVERLALLRRVVEAGHSIGQVAQLPTEELLTIDSARKPAGNPALGPWGHSEDYLAACLRAIDELDPEGLEAGLTRGAAAMGILGLLTSVVNPLIAEIDRGWTNESISISQEHMTSAVLRTFLERTRLSIPGAPHAPRLLVTTPRNQHHEIGALLVAIVAALNSWNVSYLGPNLPAEEIATTARKSRVSAIALSLVFPLEDESLPPELLDLRQRLGPATPILVGGRAADSYKSTLDEIDAEVFHSLESVGQALNRIS